MDMLSGNYNRICVTNDLDEVEKMLDYAFDRLKRISKMFAEKAMERIGELHK